MIEIVAILSSFNRAPLLKEALTSLSGALAKLDQKAAIIVLDAGSTDGSQEIVRKAIGGGIAVTLIEQAGISFAAGVNLAVEEACKKYGSAKYIFLFETDNLLQSQRPIESAIHLLKTRPEIAAAGFTARKRDGSAAGFGRNHPTWLEFVIGPQVAAKLGVDRPTLHWNREPEVCWSNCDVVYTSPILVRREAWEATGGFDATAFPFSDCDLDWAKRLNNAGMTQAVIEADEVVHDNCQCLSTWSASRALFFHRARFELLRRQYGSRMATTAPLLALRHLGELGATVLVPRGNLRVGLLKRWTLFTKSLRGYR